MNDTIINCIENIFAYRQNQNSNSYNNYLFNEITLEKTVTKKIRN